MLVGAKCILPSRENDDPKVPNISKERRKQVIKSEMTALTSHSETVND